jgi:phosphatidate cytidylyltransferase
MFEILKTFWLKYNLAQRIVTGIIGGLILLRLITYDHWTFLFVCVGLSGIALVEFLALMNRKLLRYDVIITLLAFILIWGLMANRMVSGEWNPVFLAMCSLILPIQLIALLYDKQERSMPLVIAQQGFALLYIQLPFILFYVSAFQLQNTTMFDCTIPLGIFYLQWMTDTAAYFAGKTVGRNSLFARISPKKTWEGYVAGIIGAIALGFLLDYFWVLPKGSWIVVGLIISTFSTYGDLVESMFKRFFQVKDSSAVLPGHGGMLDRFDGLLIAMPMVFFYFILIWK